GEISWSRVAERRLNASVLFNRSTVAPRRRIECLASVRGLIAHGYHRCLAPRDWEKMSKLRSAELELCAPAHAGRPNQTGGRRSSTLDQFSACGPKLVQLRRRFRLEVAPD